MIDIGITAYNEEKNIEKLLDSIITQNFDDAILINSIIVVASGCTDRTEEIVLEKAQLQSKIRLISEKIRRGKSSAINLIFQNSNADIIIFLGADVLLTKNSLNELLKPFKNRNIFASSGYPIALNDESQIVGFSSSLVWKLHNIYSKYYMTKLSGELFAIRTNILKKIPVQINCDDAFIQILLIKRELKIAYAKKAKVFLMGPQTVTDFINQRKRVLVGYSQLKSLTGFAFQTTNFLINLKLIFIYLKNHWKLKELYHIMFVIVLEAIAHFFALINRLRGNFETIWRPIRSTKSLKK